jgi:hypothetical protein
VWGQGRGRRTSPPPNHQVGIERMAPVGRGVNAGTQLEQPVHHGGRLPGQLSQPLRRRHGERREDDPPRSTAAKVTADLAVNGFPQPGPPIGTATVAVSPNSTVCSCSGANSTHVRSRSQANAWPE